MGLTGLHARDEGEVLVVFNKGACIEAACVSKQVLFPVFGQGAALAPLVSSNVCYEV